MDGLADLIEQALRDWLSDRGEWECDERGFAERLAEKITARFHDAAAEMYSER